MWGRLSFARDPAAHEALVEGAVRPRQRQSGRWGAEQEKTEVPDAHSTEDLVAALPLLKVDWELVGDQEFRNELAALNFEATSTRESTS